MDVVAVVRAACRAVPGLCGVVTGVVLGLLLVALHREGLTAVVAALKLCVSS